MMHRHAWIFALVPVSGISAGELAAQEADVLRLGPSSPWVMDYAEDSCALRRTFGEVGRQVTLEMRQFSPDSSIQFSIFSENIGTTTEWLRFGVDPDEPPTEDMHAYIVT